MECLLKYTSPWHEAVNLKPFCGFLMTSLFYKMNDSGTLPAPWFGSSRIINCLTYHISTASSHLLGTMVKRPSEGSLEPLISWGENRNNRTGHSSGTDHSSQGSGTALNGHLWGRPAVPSSALPQNHSMLCPSEQLTDRSKGSE